MIDYFFSGTEYIRVSREDTGPGSVNAGYPAPITNWNFGAFGANGIDAALYSGSKCYFFKGNQYIRVTRGTRGPGTIDAGYPKPISVWNWGAFGANGIDAALYSGQKCYFFKGDEYIRVTRGETGPGTVDAGYPKNISVWGWGEFGKDGIDGAMYSGSRCYFFKGNEYIRVTRSDYWPGTVDAGYPAPISNWNFGAFGANGIKAPLYSGGPFVATPAVWNGVTGLTSSNNYFLADGGTALTGVTMTMIFDEEFVSSANGYSFQLNGYSTHGSATQWQQFVIYISPNDNQFWARVETWAGTSAADELNRIDVALTTLPNGKIPAGYSMSMALSTDSGNNVTGATFAVVNAKGQQVATQTLTILGQTLRSTGKPATQANLAPLAAMTFSIGGDYGGSTADLSTALGTITYTSNNPLTVVNAEPSYTDFNDNTAEEANVMYGPMPGSQNYLVTQSFYQTSAGSKPGLADHRERLAKRKGRHMLQKRDEQSVRVEKESRKSEGRHMLEPREELAGVK